MHLAHHLELYSQMRIHAPVLTHTNTHMPCPYSCEHVHVHTCSHTSWYISFHSSQHAHSFIPSGNRYRAAQLELRLALSRERHYQYFCLCCLTSCEQSTTYKEIDPYLLARSLNRCPSILVAAITESHCTS